MEDDFQGMVNQSYWDFVRLLANNCQQGLYASYTFEVTEEVLSHHSMVMDMLSYEEDHEPQDLFQRHQQLMFQNTPAENPRNRSNPRSRRNPS